MRKWLLFLLLAAAVALGIVVPLIDNHGGSLATIAMQMSESGNYATLSGQPIGQAHLQFWMAATGFSWFGVNGVVYKLSALFFVILTLVSTYKLGQYLAPRRRVGVSAVFILASMAAFMVACSINLTIEPIVCGAVMLSIWQAAVAIGGGGMRNTDNYGSRRMLDRFRFLPHFALAVGMALSFSSVGIYGIIVVLLAILIYAIAVGRIRWIFSWRMLIVLGLCTLMIIPELIACYLQWSWEGVRAIVFQHLLQNPDTTATTVQWSIYSTMPWGVLLLFFAGRSLVLRRFDAIYSISIIFSLIIAVMVWLFAFKQSHYLIWLLPLLSIFIAEQLRQIQARTRLLRTVEIIQKIVVAVMMLSSIVLNYYCFEFPKLWMSIVYGLAIVTIIYSLFRPWPHIDRIIGITVVSSAIFWIGFNGSVYPQLLDLQAGTQIGKVCAHRNIAPSAIAYFDRSYRPSLEISQGKRLKAVSSSQLKDSLFVLPTRYLIIDKESYGQLTADSIVVRRGLQIIHRSPDYSLDRISLQLLNPATRVTADTIYLIDSKN